MKILLSLMVAFTMLACSAPQSSMDLNPSPTPQPTPIPEDDVIQVPSPEASAAPILKKKKAKKLPIKSIRESDKT